MSLWTPYVEDAALDLSKTADTVKEEREYASSSPNSDQSLYGHAYPSYPAPGGYQMYYGYPCQPISAISTVQMSPLSGGSTCSGYEPASLGPPLSPVLSARNLSPPESPVSQAPRKSYMDVDDLSDDPDFQAFERDAMRAMAEKNGGTLLGNNPRMRRAVRSMNQDSTNDLYRKQRERNNFAAKQSRDRRKLREIHLALKVSFLKNEVASLKTKLSTRVCKRCQQLRSS
jgi:ribosomal protein L32